MFEYMLHVCNKVYFLIPFWSTAQLCPTIDLIFLMKYKSYLLKTMQVSGKKYIVFMTIYISKLKKIHLTWLKCQNQWQKRSHNINTSNRVCYKIFAIKSCQWFHKYTTVIIHLRMEGLVQKGYFMLKCDLSVLSESADSLVHVGI